MPTAQRPMPLGGEAPVHLVIRHVSVLRDCCGTIRVPMFFRTPRPAVAALWCRRYGFRSALFLERGRVDDAHQQRRKLALIAFERVDDQVDRVLIMILQTAAEGVGE